MNQIADQAAAGIERTRRYVRLLDGLRAFVQAEREAAQEKLFEVWRQPLADRLNKGLSQRFIRLEPGPEQGTLWAYTDGGD